MKIYQFINSAQNKNCKNQIFKGELSNKTTADTARDWDKFIGDNIPSSLELSPIIYNYINQNDNICDIGMGFGKTIFELYKKGFHNLSGVDSNSSGIDFANETIKKFDLNGNFKFIIGNAENIDIESKSQDAVITQAFWTTIINFQDRKNILKEINRILKNNGILYISDFGQTPDVPKYRQRYEDGILKGYEKGTFEVIDPQTGAVEYLAHHHTKKEFTELLKEGNFKIENYSISPVKTRSGNTINGHTIIARKVN